MNTYTKNEFTFKIKDILDENDDITLILKTEINIDFGRLNDIKYKLGLINKILKALQNRNILPKEIILNKGKNPIVVK